MVINKISIFRKPLFQNLVPLLNVKSQFKLNENRCISCLLNNLQEHVCVINV